MLHDYKEQRLDSAILIIDLLHHVVCSCQRSKQPHNDVVHWETSSSARQRHHLLADVGFLPLHEYLPASSLPFGLTLYFSHTHPSPLSPDQFINQPTYTHYHDTPTNPRAHTPYRLLPNMAETNGVDHRQMSRIEVLEAFKKEWTTTEGFRRTIDPGFAQIMKGTESEENLDELGGTMLIAQSATDQVSIIVIHSLGFFLFRVSQESSWPHGTHIYCM